jgi:hypothetical protein
MKEVEKLLITDAAIASAENATEKCIRLFACVKATLLYHRGGPWSHERSEDWAKLTGMAEATTRNLCEFIRGQLHTCTEPLASSACTVETWCVRQVGHEGECSPVFGATAGGVPT